MVAAEEPGAYPTTTGLLMGMALVGWAFYSFFTVMLHLLQGFHQQ